ncbi:hypothetical protein OAK97_02000 [bacterium]|jgi:hypothetical protein|nr:hypothetical protein [bacterium]
MKYLTLTILTCLASTSLHNARAGERVIFEQESKSSLPTIDLDATKLENLGRFGNKKSSSVDAVIAPWQNPLNGAQMSAKQRRALLEALDKKNNWAFQSSEDRAGSSDLDGLEVESDSFLTTDLDSKSSRQLAEHIFYGNKKKHPSKLQRTRKEMQFRDDTENVDSDNAKELTGEDLLARGNAVTPKYYQEQFENLFKPEETLRSDRGPEALTSMSQRDVTAANMLGMGDLVPEQFSQNNPSTTRLQNFQSMMGRRLSVTMNGLDSPEEREGLSFNRLSSGDNGLLRTWQQADNRSIIPGKSLDGAIPGNAQGALRATTGLLNRSNLGLGNAGFAPSSMGNTGFQSAPRTSTLPSQGRPIFFEIPKRAF